MPCHLSIIIFIRIDWYLEALWCDTVWTKEGKVVQWKLVCKKKSCFLISLFTRKKLWLETKNTSSLNWTFFIFFVHCVAPSECVIFFLQLQILHSKADWHWKWLITAYKKKGQFHRFIFFFSRFSEHEYIKKLKSYEAEIEKLKRNLKNNPQWIDP